MEKIYRFSKNKVDGGSELKNLLGGKGANLAEMAKIGIPVPPGFTLTTEMCNFYTEFGEKKLKELIWDDILIEIKSVEEELNKKFGDSKNPLLFSVRSGARQSMPGMMDTVLNLGLNDEIVEGLSKITDNPRFAWDSYRRFIQMYGDVVLGITSKSKIDINLFEKAIDDYKEKLNIKSDLEFSIDNLKELTIKFKEIIKNNNDNMEFPQDSHEQLWSAILAVFRSWMNERAIIYREIENIPSEWGTAVNVQAMVYGNTGNNSATGVAFTRNASTGENYFNGEFLVNAQGEDVVAGVRTPWQITKRESQKHAKRNFILDEDRLKDHPSLEELMPKSYKELYKTQDILEKHYMDMQDLEFTIENGKLWLLQTRTGKRTGSAMVKIAMDFYRNKNIDEKQLLDRIKPNKIDELLHPIFKSKTKKNILTQGLPAAPGAAVGQVVFFADEVQKYEKSILVRLETSPEDINGMKLAQGFLTVRGGMTSHAAVVARGMGKCCVAGAGDIIIDYKKRKFRVKNTVISEGDFISIDGSNGEVYLGEIPTQSATLDSDFHELLNIADNISRMEVRANADTPKDAKKSLEFGATGIGLCRTEHMFFEKDKIQAMREMILASSIVGREKALNKMLPLQKQDFIEIFEVMKEKPVTIRLLDPPLHEFLPHTKLKQEDLAHELRIPVSKIREAVNHLKESNPMLGHRGCRLGITYPEITIMQTRAIIEAALEVKNKGIKVLPEIMVPLVGKVEEYILQKDLILETIENIFKKYNDKVEYKIGTMIEVPRAAIIADKIANEAEFFSFGTNDLTQMTFGYSRDDTGTFLPIYLDKNILKIDPFKSIDIEGVGELIKMATFKGRSINKNLKIGICGEHGGDPDSIDFVDSVGLNYISCSPYRIPLARIAAAKAKLKN